MRFKNRFRKQQSLRLAKTGSVQALVRLQVAGQTVSRMLNIDVFSIAFAGFEARRFTPPPALPPLLPFRPPRFPFCVFLYFFFSFSFAPSLPLSATHKKHQNWMFFFKSIEYALVPNGDRIIFLGSKICIASLIQRFDVQSQIWRRRWRAHFRDPDFPRQNRHFKSDSWHSFN